MGHELTKKQRKTFDENVAEYVVTRVSPRTIVCVLILKDGWEVNGFSACSNMEKFDEEKGIQYAFLHALSKLQYNLDNPVLLQ